MAPNPNPSGGGATGAPPPGLLFMIRSNSIAHFFVRSSAVLLFLTGVAKLYSSFGSARILTSVDPMLHLRYWQIMIGAGVLELAISAYLVRGHDMLLKHIGVLWLSTNFLIYRMANELLHIYVCPCLGTLGDALYLTREQSGFILEVLVLYLFLGSAFSLLAACSSVNQARVKGPVGGLTQPDCSAI